MQIYISLYFTDIQTHWDYNEVNPDAVVPVEDAPATTADSGKVLDRTSPIYLGRLYVFALIWSVGAFLEREDRNLFDCYLRTNYASLPLPPKIKSKENTVFDFVVGPDGNWWLYKILEEYTER